MRILCLSDIHGNHDALAAVLVATAQHSFGKVLVAGDIVFPGAQPLETWKTLTRMSAVMVQGVTDKALATLDPEKIIIYGGSLGGGVAVYLASEKPHRAAVARTACPRLAPRTWETEIRPGSV